MSLLTLREAIKTKLATVPGIAASYTHGGRFDEEDLKRYSVKAPCLVVGCLGISSMEYESGQVVANAQWGAFLIVTNTANVKRDALALTLLQGTLSVITPAERWGDDNSRNAEDIRASNLFNGKLDTTGVALWGITWTQGYELQRVDLAELDDFLTAATEVAVSENPDTPKMQASVTLPGTED